MQIDVTNERLASCFQDHTSYLVGSLRQPAFHAIVGASTRWTCCTSAWCRPSSGGPAVLSVGGPEVVDAPAKGLAVYLARRSPAVLDYYSETKGGILPRTFDPFRHRVLDMTGAKGDAKKVLSIMVREGGIALPAAFKPELVKGVASSGPLSQLLLLVAVASFYSRPKSATEAPTTLVRTSNPDACSLQSLGVEQPGFGGNEGNQAFVWQLMQGLPPGTFR